MFDECVVDVRPDCGLPSEVARASRDDSRVQINDEVQLPDIVRPRPKLRDCQRVVLVFDRHHPPNTVCDDRGPDRRSRVDDICRIDTESSEGRCQANRLETAPLIGFECHRSSKAPVLGSRLLGDFVQELVVVLERLQTIDQQLETRSGISIRCKTVEHATQLPHHL